MNDTPFQELPTYTKKTSHTGRLFLLISIIIIILALAFGGGYFFIIKGNKIPVPVMPIPHRVMPTAVPSPTPQPVTPVPTLSASASASLKRSDLTVSVLNGSGEAGAAKQIAGALTSLGYDVTVTDNADNFNYANITIEVKSGKQDYLPLLKKDIMANSTASVAVSTDDNISTDAVVIVGR
jgi:hypothetical protein